MSLPFIWLVISSFKPLEKIFIFPPEWIPNPFRPQNYIEALVYKPFGLYLFNTMKIVALNLVAVILTASFCGYGFARIRFPGRDFWFALVLSTLMIPYFVLMVPQFIMFSRLGWVDTFYPLTVPLFFGGGAFNIFLFRQFFRSLPEELADAGRIDGCSEFGIYWRIMMPLSKPALATVAIFTFLAAWNDYIGPLLYLRSDSNFTVAIGLATFRSVMRTEWNLLMAASTAMILPVIVLFFLAQRYFVEGIVLSGLKG
ncbi:MULTISPECIES: carbohydrate ABC transporter permease [Caldilinea]|uniref:Putative ABC transporter permease protein n=1 Tax=Caldilinea aerophila (strain DSM 14535 / JCM 11387 / NBRC 104270 / STL-6-O1) TaxID=926550 RepID=I0I522_CALAS|nr:MULTISPECIES: carbohydrate ABC transporter permease [Caldilinea]BAM00360.1 putative ABC transporter permease protein [Caldilinea aerophila DSM 14535 = NBRC 104270]